MCGIVGIFNLKKSENITFSEKEKSFLIKYLLAKLTIETASRGKDATGYFSLFQNKESIGLKHGVDALKFCTKDWDTDNGKFNFKNHLNLIEAYHNEVSQVASIMSHCRAKTVGVETDNNNNHPIHVNNIVGIHNGCLSNHYKISNTISDDITRVGAVDSEMIFQLLWLLTNKGQDEFNSNTIKTLTKRLDGSFAVICVNKEYPNSVLFVRDTRPIEFVYIKEAGLLIAVSEKKFFESAENGYSWLKYYGIKLPPFSYKNYSLPDDNGFILDLNKKIEKKDSIKDIIGDLIKIEKTDTEWKSCSYGNSAGSPSGSYPNSNMAYNRSRSTPQVKVIKSDAETETKDETDNKKVDTGNKDTTHNEDTNKCNLLALPGKTNSGNYIETAKWNAALNAFETVYASEKDTYREMENHFLEKFTVFRSNKTLETKLNIDDITIDSLTSLQLANRISKVLYDEHVGRKALEIQKLKEEAEKNEIKATKTRRHIINLRAIVNSLTQTLCLSYKEGQFNLNKNESEPMKSLWNFLYCNNKEQIRNTTLGKFIVKLSQKNENESK